MAYSLPNQVPEDVKLERYNILMEIQREISRENLQKYVGTELKILVEKSLHHEWPGLFQGRAWFQAPEVDGVTYVSGPGCKVGEFVDAVIESSTDYDLSALSIQSE